MNTTRRIKPYLWVEFGLCMLLLLAFWVALVFGALALINLLS